VVGLYRLPLPLGACAIFGGSRLFVVGPDAAVVVFARPPWTASRRRENASCRSSLSPAWLRCGCSADACRARWNIRDPDPRLRQCRICGCGSEVMAWVLLLVAGLFEVGWAIGLKYTEGFTRVWPSVFTLAAMTASVVLLGMAMKSLPVGTSYAIWVGVGAVGTAILGIILFGESANAGRLFSLGLIVAGIVGLKLTTPV